jgi:hypothetical protein
VLIIIDGNSPPFVPPLVDHTRYFRHAPACLRVVANMCGLARGYAAVCPLRRLWLAEGATQAGCRVRLILRGYKHATFTHAFISSLTAPLLSLSIVNY